MSSWSEIQKLAADFQRVQLGQSAKRLSDRNCVELVSRLIEEKAIDVVYSVDGKEYITRTYLATQVKNEAIANGGRIALTELPHGLGVEYPKIEECVNEIVRTDGHFMLCLGQLISRTYVDSIRNEVQDLLEEEGVLTLSQLTKSRDLPSGVLRDEVFSSLHGYRDKQNSDIIYTKAWLNHIDSSVRGILSGLTKPKPLSGIAGLLGISLNLVVESVDKLIKTKAIAGTLAKGTAPVFTPACFVSSTIAHAQEFYAQNGYIELAVLKRAGQPLNDAIASLDKTAIQLDKCLISKDCWTGITATVESAVQANGWADFAGQLPSIVSTEDAAQLLKLLSKSHTDWLVTADEAYVIAAEQITTLPKRFDNAIQHKAQSEAPNWLDFMRRTKGDGSIGGESLAADDVPAKGGKRNKGKTTAKNASKSTTAKSQSDTSKTFSFMTQQEVANYLREHWSSAAPDEVLNELAERLENPLNAAYRTALQAASSIILQSTAADTRKTHADFEQKYRRLLHLIYVADAGCGVFEETDAALIAQLRQFLLRTWCSDLLVMTCAYLSGGEGQIFAASTGKLLTAQQIESAVKGVKRSEAREALEQWRRAVLDKDVEDLNQVFAASDDVCAPDVCDIHARPPDKKTKAQLVAEHYGSLESELRDCTDPAAGLLLALLILFMRQHPNCILHASGKFVPQLMRHILKGVEQEETRQLLHELQQLVIAQIAAAKGKKNDSEPVDVVEKFCLLKNAILPS